MKKELIFKTREGVKLFGYTENNELISLETSDLTAVTNALKEDLTDSNFVVRNLAMTLLALLNVI